MKPKISDWLLVIPAAIALVLTIWGVAIMLQGSTL